MAQARAGRVVMSVDSTNLLNLRHVFDTDDKWRRCYPPPGEVMTFEDVCSYGNGSKLAIVTYGNGVLAALQARAALTDAGGPDCTVIDSPYLSRVRNQKAVIFLQSSSIAASPVHR